MKKCLHCKRSKLTHLFSNDRKRPDGKYPYCKACVRRTYHERYAWKEQTPEYKARHKAWRDARPEWALAQSRKYEEANRAKRRKDKRDRYAKFRAEECARAKRVREKFKDHCRARWALAQQIRYHGLKKKPCEDCGTRMRVQAHHHKGYSRAHWLDVIWLCPPCHGRRHREEIPSYNLRRG